MAVINPQPLPTLLPVDGPVTSYPIPHPPTPLGGRHAWRSGGTPPFTTSALRR